MFGFGRKESVVRPITVLGTALAVGGLSGLFPGVKDVFIAIAAKVGGTPNPEVPIYLAAGVLAIGTLMVLVDQIAAGRKKLPGRTLIAFRHHSLQAVPAPLLAEGDLPRWPRPILLEHRDCDQTVEMSGSKQDYALALGVQDRHWTWLASRLQSFPRPEFAYYGVAHIPFQILMGCQLSHTSPLLLELSRQDRTWKELLKGRSHDLGLTTIENKAKLAPTSVVIRLSISYPVALEDVRAIILEPFDDVEIRLRSVGIDQITRYSHVQEVVSAFRLVLDSSMQRLPPGGTVHLFYAGPMSLGFSLGKAISWTNHPTVTAYNHTRQSDPRYSWGVIINSLHSLPVVVMPSVVNP